VSAQETTNAAAVAPLSTSFSYTGVLQANVAGGVRRGTTYGGAAALQLALTLDHLVQWRGAQVFLFVLDTHGGMPTDLVGALQAVSGIEALPGVRVEEIWVQQNVLNGRLSLLVGRYDMNTEFYRIQSSALFVHSSLGIGPEFAQSGVEGPSTFPYTAVGARAAFKPSANTVFRAAVINGTPVDRPGGGARLFAHGDGALLMGELATLDRADTANLPRDRRFLIGRGGARPYERKVALGVWHYTSSFPDLADTLTSGSAVQHRGSSGAYLIADQSLWKANGAEPRVLFGFVQLGIGDARANRVGRYAGGGFTVTNPLPRRPQDQIGLAAAVAMLGSHYRRTFASSTGSTASETDVELNYAAQLKAWLAAQADLQYVVFPGGTRAMPNALIPGIRVALTL
jgi:porin